MFEDRVTADVFTREWETYQDRLKAALAPLTAEQLALCAAPHLRSIGVDVRHIIAARVWWFHKFLGEGDPAIMPLVQWDDDGQPARSADELLYGLDETWKLVKGCLERWTPEDLQKTFPRQRRGEQVELSRAWVVWHILEHDLHHGGEVSLMLGMHGLAAPDI